MPCKASDNSFDVAVPPGPVLPGFGLALSPFQIPLPNFDLPTELVEDILALMQQLGALFPSGLFKANPDFSMKCVLDFIANILSQIAPFLSFYNFIMAALNLFICIIEVLCAIPNPFAVASKLADLFSKCLPPFLNLFPWLALIAMIIALLLLIIALILYIINTILAIIEAIIANIEILIQGFSLQDVQATLAAIQKIASLLCFIQNLLAILVAIAAIIAVIKALASFAGGSICSDDDTEGCCAPATCPDFVKNTPDGIPVTSGTLVYHNQIGADIANIFASLSIPGIEDLLSVPPIREERWQLVDNDYLTATYPINLIITEVFDPLGFLSGNIIGNIFWPDPLEFDSTTAQNKIPYTVDIRVELDPVTFNPLDLSGRRFMRINGCSVVRKPYLGVLNQVGQYPFLSLDTVNFGGTLNIEGGLVFEDDGTTKYEVGGEQATLNTFIHKDTIMAASSSAIPTSDDGVVFSNVSFVWKPNAPALAGYNLTTVGCIPSVSIEKAVVNAVINAEGIEPVIVKLNGKIAPDIDTAISCAQDALTQFRKSINVANAGIFRSKIQTCLTTLQNETEQIVCDAIRAAVSAFKSTIEVDTDVQFTTRPITTTVVLKDPSGTTISTNIPDTCAGDITDKIVGHVSLGEITKFTYDKTNGNFHAKITSDKAGTGALTVSFDNKDFSTVIPATTTTSSSIVENIVSYTFIDGVVEPIVRRDAGDTAREGE